MVSSGTADQTSRPQAAVRWCAALSCCIRLATTMAPWATICTGLALRVTAFWCVSRAGPLYSVPPAPLAQHGVCHQHPPRCGARVRVARQEWRVACEWVLGTVCGVLGDSVWVAYMDKVVGELTAVVSLGSCEPRG
eukprot:m.773062 g.773062  ORF g.773062 m.773062 type:complete len:136 (-) comp23248_c0_seq60:77-484(-)